MYNILAVYSMCWDSQAVVRTKVLKQSLTCRNQSCLNLVNIYNMYGVETYPYRSRDHVYIIISLYKPDVHVFSFEISLTYYFHFNSKRNQTLSLFNSVAYILRSLIAVTSNKYMLKD